MHFCNSSVILSPLFGKTQFLIHFGVCPGRKPPLFARFGSVKFIFPGKFAADFCTLWKIHCEKPLFCPRNAGYPLGFPGNISGQMAFSIFAPGVL